MQPVNKPIVLAIVGLAGVGKSMAAEIISSWLEFEVVYFGGVVLHEVKNRGLDVTPSNEAVVREDLRREFGMAVMALKSLPAISAAVGSGRHVLIDGLYSHSEYILLKQHFGSQIKTIAIHSDKMVRAERLGHRPVRPLTVAEMDTRDEKEVALLEKAPPIALADFHVLNNQDVVAYTAALRGCFDTILGMPS